MIKIGIIVLCSAFSWFTLARTPDLNGRYFNSIQKSDDLYLELQALSMKDLLNEKIVTAKLYYWKGNFQVVFDEDTVSKDIQRKIQEQFNAKMRIIIGFDFKTWIAPYQFVEEKNNTFIYIDETGLLENSKIELTISKNTIEIVEHNSSGKVRTEYQFEKKDWSRNLLVLTQVEKNIQEYSDKIYIQTKLFYEKVDKQWFVNQIEVKTKQQIVEKVSTPVEREIDEVFLIKNIKFNQAYAKKWFEKKSSL